MPVYELSIGDNGGDGHEQTRDFTVRTSHNSKDIEKALTAAEKVWGYKIQDRDARNNVLFSEAEDDKMPKDALKKLKEMGVDFTQFDNELKVGEDWTPEDCATLVFELVKTQIPDFEYEYVSHEQLNFGNIGYGCFSF